MMDQVQFSSGSFSHSSLESFQTATGWTPQTLRTTAKRTAKRTNISRRVHPSISVKEGRTEAELMANYMPVVKQIAGGFQKKLPSSVERDDLIAAGMSGLWDAVRRQLDMPNERFESYVRMRIRGAILDELRSQDWLSRRARSAAVKAEERGDHTRSVAPAIVRFEDVSVLEQGKCLATACADNAEASLIQKRHTEALTRAVSELPARERHIVAAHYFHGVRFKELGIELGVSEPRVSQLHSRAMRRLRTLISEEQAA